MHRKSRAAVSLGLFGETAYAGDHLAYFYETDAQFVAAFGFVDEGLLATDHVVLFGVPQDTERMVRALSDRGWDVAAQIEAGRLSVLRPEPTCAANVAAVSRHFSEVLSGGASFIRFLGNAAVDRDGWPSAEEFYELEAAVSAATLSLPCVAICMFDLRTQSAGTIMKAAFEGHPLTMHRNCLRENPLYVPRSVARS